LSLLVLHFFFTLAYVSARGDDIVLC